MTSTTRLALPLLASNQAQKHVTHNEALLRIDDVVQASVISRASSSPPGSPAEEDRYIVGGSATGLWSGEEGKLTIFRNGAWMFIAPWTGFTVFVEDEVLLLYYDGSNYQTLDVSAITELQNLTLLGVGTTADATNPLAAKINKALFTAKTVAEGGTGDLRYTLSKEAASNILSFLFQTNYSGRAELGLTGDDDLHIKTSPDGTSWTEALKLNKTSGAVTLAVDLAISEGGTGASTASGARANLAAAALGANTDITSVYLNNTGLKVKDTNASHGLSIVPGSDITADRTLTLVTGDADRTWTMSGNFTMSGAFGFTMTLTGTTSVTFPTSGTLATTSNKLSAFAATTSAELAGVISDETGSGALVFGASPTLTGVSTDTLASTSTTDATSATSAPLKAAGGLAVAKKTYHGDLVTVTKNAGTLPAAVSGSTLHLAQADGAVNRITLDGFASLGVINFRRANNTAASPSAVSSGDILGAFGVFGYGSTGYGANGSANIIFYADQNFTDASQGGSVAFSTTPNGTNSVVERVRINNAGITNFYHGANVASAATITPTGNSFHVTGTTTITSVSGTGIQAGTRITIIFDGVLTFTDGSNLKLAGNFVTTADDTISLVYDGTNWFETGRSVN